jgi:hypothetical protein
MPQEVIDRVNQLGSAEGQPELLTFYDRKGRLIGETTPQADNTQDPDPQDEQDDGLEDLNPPAVNHTCGIDEQQDIDLPIADTVEQVQDPIITPEVQTPETLQPDPLQPDEHIPPEVLNPGATHGLHVAHNAPKQNHNGSSLLFIKSLTKAPLPLLHTSFIRTTTWIKTTSLSNTIS